MKNNISITMSNGYYGYGMKKVSDELNKKGIGKNIVMEYLRELGITDSTNSPLGIYKDKYYLQLLEGRSGYYKLVISDQGLDYFKNNGIYEKLLAYEIIDCAKRGIKM